MDDYCGQFDQIAIIFECLALPSGTVIGVTFTLRQGLKIKYRVLLLPFGFSKKHHKDYFYFYYYSQDDDDDGPEFGKRFFSKKCNMAKNNVAKKKIQRGVQKVVKNSICKKQSANDTSVCQALRSGLPQPRWPTSREMSWIWLR